LDAISPTINLTGKVVMYNSSGGRSIESVLKRLANRGIAALFSLYSIGTAWPGAGNWVREGGKLPAHDFPTFEITTKQNKTLAQWFKNQTHVIVSLEHDPNPWDKTFAIALPIVGISILIFSGIILLLAVWKLGQRRG
jgi:hypothetical protein